MTALGGRRRLLKDGAWVSIGQVGSAVGTLMGIRILTEYADPGIFGAVTLLLGVSTLAMGTLVTPVMQAALRFYPEYADGRVSLLRTGIISILSRRLILCLALVALLSPLLMYLTDIRLSFVFLCLLLLLLDSVRTMETTLMNAARKQAPYALIAIAEAGGRPVAAVVAIRLMGANAEAVLLAYALTSLAILLFYYSIARPTGIVPTPRQCCDFDRLKSDIRKYALPLSPMSALGWMNGVGDRYLIGAMLGLEQAGIYAAVYGLVSRPFLMASGIVELTLRPVYNHLVVEQSHREADRLLLRWLLTVTCMVGAGFAGIAIFSHLIVNLLLAAKYRSGVNLMLWIAGGYALLALSDVFVKVCYAYGYTGRILMMQLVGAVLSLALAIIGIKLFGLIGAAMALPAYFGAILIISILSSRVKPDQSPLAEIAQADHC